MTLTRRHFTLSAVAALAATRLPAQDPDTDPSRTVAAMDHDNILAAAAQALNAQPQTMEDVSAAVAALTAAFVLTQQEHYALAAYGQLTHWLPAPMSQTSNPPSVLELVPLAELARSTSFLVDAVHTDPIDAWFADLLHWLTTSPTPTHARDALDHNASAWLLLTAAVARSQRNQTVLNDCRNRFRDPTLRNQIDEDGSFPNELSTATPFRNVLFNFDLLCGACQLLDSAEDRLWTYKLVDNVSLHNAAEWLVPVLQDPTTWPGPYRAKPAHKHHTQPTIDLPGRRPGLLFAGIAYEHPEYVDLWLATSAAIPTSLVPTFPIRQPILWTTSARHGF